jgi:hypothetical protein
VDLLLCLSGMRSRLGNLSFKVGENSKIVAPGFYVGRCVFRKAGDHKGRPYFFPSPFQADKALRLVEERVRERFVVVEALSDVIT